MILSFVLRQQAHCHTDALDWVYLARVGAGISLHGLLVSQVHVGAGATLAVDTKHSIAKAPRPKGIGLEGDIRYWALYGSCQVVGRGIEPRIPLRDGQHVLVGLSHALLL